VEARWGHVVLPPGDYSFTLDHASNDGKIMVRRGTKTVAMMINQGIRDWQTSDHSALVLVRSGGNYTIRALRLAELGMTLEYSVPKTGKQLIVQAPQLLERIPVMMGG